MERKDHVGEENEVNKRVKDAEESNAPLVEKEHKRIQLFAHFGLQIWVWVQVGGRVRNEG